ncbi:MAG: Flp pilus assembly protein CpaB [Dehalococcoidia bacterium]
MSRVNRRFMLLALILAALSAILVYAALSGSSGSDGGAGPVAGVTVVVAQVNIPAGATITGDMLGVANTPEEFVSQGSFASIESVLDEVARYPIAANQQILLSDLVGGPTTASNDVLSHVLEGGLRGLGVETQAVVGAGGLVLPGDYVDIYWVPDDPLTDIVGAQMIAEDIEVVSVDQTIVEVPPAAPGLLGEDAPPASAEDRVRAVDEAPMPAAVTVTLMVTPEEASVIFCSEETGELRLAVRAFGDHGPSGLLNADCSIVGQAS